MSANPVDYDALASQFGGVDVDQQIEESAQRHGVDPALVRSVVKQESGFNPNATSPKGARGLMQLMPDTATSLGVTDAYDPKQNIDAGVRHLKRLQTKFGDDRKAVAAYNAGEGAVEKHNGVPPFKETQDYVNKILGPEVDYDALAKKFGGEVEDAKPAGNDIDALVKQFGGEYETTGPTIPGYGPVPGVPRPKVPGLDTPAIPAPGAAAPAAKQPTGINPELTTGTGFSPSDFAGTPAIHQQEQAYDSFLKRWGIPKFDKAQTVQQQENSAAEFEERTPKNIPPTQAEVKRAYGLEGVAGSGLSETQMSDLAKEAAKQPVALQNLYKTVGDSALNLVNPENIAIALTAEFGAAELKAAANSQKIVKLLETLPGGDKIKKAIDLASRSAIPAVFGTQAAEQSYESAKAGEPVDAIVNGLLAAASLLGIHENAKGTFEAYPTPAEKATTAGGEAAATAKAYAAAGENLKASEWAKAVKVDVDFNGKPAFVRFTGVKGGNPEFELVDKEHGEVHAAGSYDDIQDALHGKQPPAEPPAGVAAGAPPEPPPSSPPAPSGAEAQVPQVTPFPAENAGASALPGAAIPPAAAPPVAVGSVFEVPGGKFTVKGIEDGRVSYEKETASGKVIPGKLSEDVFRAMVGRSAPAAPAEAQPIPAPASAVESNVGEPVPAERQAAPAAEPIPPTISPAIPGSGLKPRGTPENPLPHEVIRPGTQPPGEPMLASPVSAATPPEAKQEVTVYRGVRSDGADNAVGTGKFYAGDRKVAEQYAGEGGTVQAHKLEFENLLTADTWQKAKEALGLPRSATMPELIEAAKKAGHDGITFKTPANGQEYIHISEAEATATPEAPAEPERKFSSTQVNLPEEMAQKVRDYGLKIPEAKLAEDGRESEPHATVLYGIHAAEPKSARAAITGHGPITVKIGKLSVFKTDGADVLKFDVESPDLHALNAKVAGEVEHTSTHPTYVPHITVAYLKPGEGKQYAGKPVPGLTGKSVTFDKVVFSPHEGEKAEIALSNVGENPQAAAAPAEVQPSPFNHGDRVAWTDRRGKALSGTIRSIDRYAGEASIDTDQIMHAGGVPIGRIETVKLDRLSSTKSDAEQPPVASPAETPTMEAANGTVPAADRPPLEGQLPEGSGSPGPVGAAHPGGGEGGLPGEPSPRGSTGEGTELEPSGGTVNGAVGDPAHPERTFPPRAQDVVSTHHDRDYRIPDGRKVSGSPEARARINIEAIKVLRQVEAEKRTATVEEQHTLAKYMGWGAVPQLFAANTPEFQALQAQLKELVSAEEYSNAARSTTNAHYTGDNVVDGIWKAMQALGAQPGMSWLEPAVGIGNFFGRQPEALLEGARRIGLDKDALTGGIAKLLYPDSGIDITAFEEAELPKNYFDAAISNVPFGNFGVHDAEFRGKPFLTNPIHNYFFAKSLGMVRPGGIIGFVTSRYTMDGYEAGHTNLRKWLNDRADFLGAVRLPSGAFRENAGTEVITDIIFLRRRLPDAAGTGEPWLETTTKRLTSDRGTWPHEVNEYYTKHPEMILGQEGLQRGQFSDHDYDVKGAVTQEALEKALTSIAEVGKFQEFTPTKKSRSVAIRELNTPEQAKLGGMFFDAKGNLFRKTSKGAAEPMDVSGTAKERIRGQLSIRDARVALTDAELADKPKPELDLKRQKLNKLYDSYVAKHGPLSSQSNTSVMKGDPDAPLLVALEKKFDKGNKKAGIAPKAEKHPLFSRRMLMPPETPTSVSDPKDALYITLNQKGRLDFDRMSELTGRTTDQLKSDLAGLVYEDPTTKTWQTAEEYLSGSVRTKLKQARAIAKVEPKYEPNVKALELAQPEDIPPGKIRVLLGVTWVPLDTYGAFASEMLGSERPLKVHYAGGEWIVDGGGYNNRLSKAPLWGTARVGAKDLLQDTLNMRRTKVTDRDSDGNVSANPTETKAARAKQMEMQDHFEKWLFAEPKRGDEMVRLYNDLQNDLRLRTYDGAHLTLPGMSRDAAVVRGGDLDPHQKAAVWRQIVQPNVMLAHSVGTGKTFEMIAGGMELQRLGLIKRPMYVVPNATLTGWQHQFSALYPQKRVLVFTEKDLAKDKRQRVMAQIATGDWDAVVVPHSSFQFIPTGDDIFNEHFEKLSNELEEAISEASQAGVDTRQVKRMEKAKERLLTSLKDRRAAERQDLTVSWEQLGIDQLLVDESHEYKKLGFSTKQGNVAGIDQQGNQKTFDLQMKVRYTQKFGRGVTFATGTPVTNTMGELYSIMKYLIEPELEARGMGKFDEWAANYGRTVDIFEPKVEGGGYQMKARFAQFVNIPELAQLFRSFADVVTSDMVDIPRPELIGGEREAVVTDLTPEQEYILENDLQPRAKAIRANPKDALPDNMLAVYSDADKMALDIRLLDPGARDLPTSRANKVADKAKKWYDESAKVKGTQLIFSDIGVPHDGQSRAFELYKDLAEKLVDRGIPRNEIAFIHDAKTKVQRDKLFQKVSDGDIRILIGSTPRMGVGVNVQQKLYGLHHVSIPHRPSDLEQREGRIMRQGNENPAVHIAYYLTRGSLDEVKYGSVVRKAKFINQMMQGKAEVREAEDVGGMIPSLEMFQAMASGDPRVMRKMEVDAEVDRLSSVYSGWKNQQWKIRSELSQVPGRISHAQVAIDALTQEIKTRDAAEGKWVIKKKAFDGSDKQQFKDLDEFLKKEAEQIQKLPKDPSSNIGNSKEVDLGTSNGLEVSALHHENPFDREHGYVRFYVGGTVVDIDDKELQGGVQIARRIQNRIDDLEVKRADYQGIITKAEKDKADLEAGLGDKWPYTEKFQKLVQEQQDLIKALGGDKDDESAGAVGEGGEIKDTAVEAQEQEPTEEEEGSGAEEESEVSPAPRVKNAGERGSAPILTDLAQTIYDTVAPKFRDDVNYSGMGAIKDVFVRNLSQLSRASGPADAAAIQLASYKARAATILHAAVGPMTKALHGSGVSLDEVFSALIQDRLNAIRDRYLDLGRQAGEATDEDLPKVYTDTLADLLDAIEGRKDLPSDLTQIAGALVENEAWGDLREFLQDTFSHAASRVATMLEPEWFHALVERPEVQEAVRIYKAGPEAAMAEAHRVHEGIFSTALGQEFGAYYPLTPVEMPAKRGSGRTLPFHKPRNMNNMFATGLSDEYDPGRGALRKRLENSIHGSDKFNFLNVLEEEGWLVPAQNGQTTFIQPDGKEVPGSRVEMAPRKVLLKPGEKPINVPARMGIMPKWLKDEVDPLLEGKDFGNPGNFVTKIINAINTVAVAGLAEPIFHGRNILGGVMQATPFIGKALAQKGMGAFLHDWDAAIEALNLHPSEEEMAQDFMEMAKYGIVPDRFGAISYSRAAAEQMGGRQTRFGLSPLLFGTNGLDINARWLLYRVQKQLNPNATPREINDFVNLLGNYTYGLQSKAERILKSIGLSPFITAGNAGIRRGVKTWTGMGQNPNGGAGDWLLHQLFVGGVAGLILWAIIHKAITGQYPDKKRDAEIGYITLPSEYRHSDVGNIIFGKGSGKVKVNVMFWNPDFGRGARALGLARGFRTQRLGGNAEQVAEGAFTDMLDSWTQPLMGPVPRVGMAAGLGAESYLTGLRDQNGRPAPQFFPALPRKTSVFPMQIPGTNVGTKLHGLPANAAWRAGAAVKEMNSFYHAIGQATGLFPQSQDETDDNFRRTMVNLAFPGMFKKASDSAAAADRLERQRQGMK